MANFRPDVLGEVITMRADGTYIDPVYLASEAAAVRAQPRRKSLPLRSSVPGRRIHHRRRSTCPQAACDSTTADRARMRTTAAHLPRGYATRDQLDVALDQLRADAHAILEVGRVVGPEYLAGTAPFQDQIHTRALVSTSSPTTPSYSRNSLTERQPSSISGAIL